jgi:hypothetical protein
MAGADDDAVIGLFQRLGHAALPPLFCDAENSKFPGVRTQIFAWRRRSTRCLGHCEPTGPARSGRPDGELREAIQVSRRSVDCFVAFAPRNDADMLRSLCDEARIT